MSKIKTSSFAKQFEELEKIAANLEKSDLDLENSVTEFERGLRLAAELKKRLEKTEHEIIALKRKYHIGEEDSNEV